EGADVSDISVLARCASEAELPGEDLGDAIASVEIKDELRRVTQDAWDAGVRGVPTLRLGTELYYGDDQLERAAERLRADATQRPGRDTGPHHVSLSHRKRRQQRQLDDLTKIREHAEGRTLRDDLVLALLLLPGLSEHGDRRLGNAAVGRVEALDLALCGGAV